MENSTTTTTILLLIISILLTVMSIFCGSILLSMRSFKKDVKEDISNFIKEFRPIINEFTELKAEHNLLTGDGKHIHRFPSNH